MNIFKIYLAIITMIALGAEDSYALRKKVSKKFSGSSRVRKKTKSARSLSSTSSKSSSLSSNQINSLKTQYKSKIDKPTFRNSDPGGYDQNSNVGKLVKKCYENAVKKAGEYSTALNNCITSTSNELDNMSNTAFATWLDDNCANSSSNTECLASYVEDTCNAQTASKKSAAERAMAGCDTLKANAIQGCNQSRKRETDAKKALNKAKRALAAAQKKVADAQKAYNSAKSAAKQCK